MAAIADTSRCSSASGPVEAPRWCLEPTLAEAEDGAGAWRLTVECPEGCAPSCVDFTCEEIRFDLEAQRWRLEVPACARPVGPAATCRVARRRRRFHVEWPRSGVAPEVPLTGVALPSGSEADGAPCVAARDGAEGLRGASGGDGRGAPGGVASIDAAGGGAGAPGVEAGIGAAGGGAGAPGREAGIDAAGGGSGAPCFGCGKPGSSLCTGCRVTWYCSQPCQRSHWTAGHRTHCAVARRLASVGAIRRRGEAELALVTAEGMVKEIVSSMKSESEKGKRIDRAAALVVLCSFAHVVIALAAALSEPSIPDAKFCRGAFRCVTALLDMAAMLGEKRRPKEVQFHVDMIIAGVEDFISKEADRILSAWMFFDGYARGLEDRPSSYTGKLGQVKAAALVAFRDTLACAHDVLESSGFVGDSVAAQRVDKLLDTKRLRLSSHDFQQLRPFCPERRRSDSSSEDD